MRKKLVLALALTLLTIAAIGAVGSAAWFTDQSQVPISATGATLDIRAEVGRPGLSMDWYDPAGVPLTVDELAPGVLDPDNVWMISVQNKPAVDADLAVKYRYTASMTTSVPAAFWESLYVLAEGGACVSNDIGVPFDIYEGLLKDMVFTNADNTWHGGAALPVNSTHCYRFSFYLDEAAGNELQGGSADFKIVIDATQPENPGW